MAKEWTIRYLRGIGVGQKRKLFKQGIKINKNDDDNNDDNDDDNDNDKDNDDDNVDDDDDDDDDDRPLILMI